MSKDKLWFSWETQRRNKELSDAFGCDYVRLDYSSLPRITRYGFSIWHTLIALWRGKPKVVFSQCPSIVLSALLGALKKVFKYRLVVDAHNAACESLIGKSWLERFLVSYSFAKADFILVSNTGLLSSLGADREKGIPLSDKLPAINTLERPAILEGLVEPIVTLIATFKADEPLYIFLEAVASLDYPFTLFVTGKKERAGALLKYESEKIRFTDYLAAEQFDALIQHSALLVDLTTRENCLVCGAYEALAVQVPILLSDSPALRATFPRGALFAGNSVSRYRQAMIAFFQNRFFLLREMQVLSRQFPATWNAQFEAVRQKVFNE